MISLSFYPSLSFTLFPSSLFCCFHYESRGFFQLLFRCYVTAIPKDYFTTEAFLRFGRSNIYCVRSFTQLLGSFSCKELPALVVEFLSFFMFTHQQELHSGRFLHATFTPQSQLKGVFCSSLRDGIERPFCSLVTRLYFTKDQLILFYQNSLP